MAHYRTFAVVTSMLVALFANLNAILAEEPAEAIRMLTGGTNREWLAGDVKTWMGENSTCSSGKIYRFSNDYTAHLEECIAGKRHVKNLTWSMKKDGPLDVVLMLDGKTYTVIFPLEQGHQHMILRKKGPSKIDPIIDHTFVLSED